MESPENRPTWIQAEAEYTPETSPTCFFPDKRQYLLSPSPIARTESVKFVWEDVIAVKQNVKRQSNSLGLFVKELSGWGKPHQWRRNFGCNAKYQLANFAEAAAVADSCHLSRILSLKRGQVKYCRPNTLMKGSKCKLSMHSWNVRCPRFQRSFFRCLWALYKLDLQMVRSETSRYAAQFTSH